MCAREEISHTEDVERKGFARGGRKALLSYRLTLLSNKYLHAYTLPKHNPNIAPRPRTPETGTDSLVPACKIRPSNLIPIQTQMPPIHIDDIFRTLNGLVNPTASSPPSPTPCPDVFDLPSRGRYPPTPASTSAPQAPPSPPLLLAAACIA